jgi:HD-GYP domain-containing protein (c-di-GMP phosphodiesterase class II)
MVNGYSDRLCGTEVPASTRIEAVADAYDAMTTDRPYRARFSRVTTPGILTFESV